ncbi:hypothetical protein V8C44DRAFT_76548 [Trichoderma aethiopicum]
MLQRHALVTSCMRVHAPCQAVDRPSCQNAADIAEQGGFPRPVICKVHMRPPRSEVETSSQSLASYPIFSRAPYATKVRCMGRAACLSGGCASPHSEGIMSCRVLRAIASHDSIGRLVLYQFLRCDLSCCYSTSAMLCERHLVAKSESRATRAEKEMNIAQSFHLAYKLTIYTWFISPH